MARLQAAYLELQLDSVSSPPPLRGSWAKGCPLSLLASQPAPVECPQSTPLVSFEQQVTKLQEIMDKLEPEFKFAVNALETENNNLDAENRKVLEKLDVSVRDH